MKLEAIQNYSGAKYPTMAGYLAGKARGRTVSRVVVVMALAALATLMGGCATIS